MTDDAADVKSRRASHDQQHTRTEPMSDGAAERGDDARKMLHVTVKRPGRETTDQMRLEMVEDAASGRVAKDQVRLEMVDDAPSPSSATDPQQPSPSPSLEYYDHLPKSDSISVSVQQYAFSFFGFQKLVFTLFQLTFQKKRKMSLAKA